MINSEKSQEVLVEIKKLPKSQVEIYFKVPVAEFEKFIDQEKQELAKEAKIDGFRPGKVPKNILEKIFGLEKIIQGAAERTIKKIYVKTVIDKNIDVISEPIIEIAKLAKGNDLEFKATVSVLPKVQLKENWKEEIRKINQEFSKRFQREIVVSEDEIKRELDFLAKQRAKLVTVNRPAQKGDQLEIDLRIEKNRVPLENGTAKKQQIVLGERLFIPGFEEKLEGAKMGDELNFSLKLPSKYHISNLAGEKVDFNVRVNLIQSREIPPIDDNFASRIGKFKDLAELKKNLKEGIGYEKKHKIEDKQKREIIESLIKNSQVEIPEILIENEIKKMMAELEQDVASLGLDKASYLNQIKKTEEELMKEWRKEAASKRVQAALILRELAEQEAIIPESKEIEERMNRILQYYSTLGEINEKLDMKELYNVVKGELTNQKVFEFLMKL